MVSRVFNYANGWTFASSTNLKFSTHWIYIRWNDNLTGNMEQSVKHNNRCVSEAKQVKWDSVHCPRACWEIYEFWLQLILYSLYMLFLFQNMNAMQFKITSSNMNKLIIYNHLKIQMRNIDPAAACQPCSETQLENMVQVSIYISCWSWRKKC